jgi:hypothetical protein
MLSVRTASAKSVLNTLLGIRQYRVTSALTRHRASGCWCVYTWRHTVLPFQTETERIICLHYWCKYQLIITLKNNNNNNSLWTSSPKRKTTVTAAATSQLRDLSLQHRHLACYLTESLVTYCAVTEPLITYCTVTDSLITYFIVTGSLIT